MEEEYPEETFSEKHPILKKSFIILIASFLLLIVLIYFLTNPQIRDILAGLMESSTVNNFEVDLKSGGKLIFANNTYKELTDIHNDNPEKEFKVCLQGEINKIDYIIYSIFKPEMFLQTHNKVVSESCPKESLVSMHSHPLKHCLPSEIDLRNFELFEKQNPNALMAIMCEKDRFNFY